MRSSYGSVLDGGNSPYNDEDYDFATELSPMSNQLPKREVDRRWSVLDKLQSRHYIRIRNCTDLYNSLTWKFFLSLGMLILFFYCAYGIVKTLFVGRDLSNKYDYIIIGAGPAG